MPSLTIHAIDPALDLRLTEQAQGQKISKNQLIKNLLAQATGLPVEGAHQDDYREFCGLWTLEEAQEFENSQAGSNTVDPEDWL